MAFWSRKTSHYWIGAASRFLKDGQPEKVLAAVSHLYKYRGKKDQDSQAAYGLAVFFSGMAYVALSQVANARIWLIIFENLNPPNKDLLEILRKAVKNLEASMQIRKKAHDDAIETLEKTGGEKGFWLGKGYKSIERGMTDQAIEAFNKVLNLCSISNPKKIVRDKIDDGEQLNYVSLALLGLVLSYSAVARFDDGKEYLVILDRINPIMANEFRETWKRS